MLISDFARLGQVSVRMLRHYDAIGLLVPERVDPWNGYRSYAPEQLHALNRIVALKDLGFTLEQVAHLLDNIGAPEVTFSADELQALNAALAAITIEGERLPPAVAVLSGVEAPLK